MIHGTARDVERAEGQSLVEFALVIPLFIVLLLAVLEFALLFNALLATTFASRDAALVAAEVGNAVGGDCAILQTVDAGVGAPADRNQIQTVVISWTDVNGNVRQNAGLPYSNTWTRGAGRRPARGRTGRPSRSRTFGVPTTIRNRAAAT